MPLKERVEVFWDGTRVGRVPLPHEIEAVVLLSESSGVREVSKRLGLQEQRAQYWIRGAMYKLHAACSSEALYQLYRLQLVKTPSNPWLQPILEPDQRDLLYMLCREGLNYDQVAARLKIGHNQVGNRTRYMFEILGATHRVQALRLAVERGDVRIRPPKDLWKGVV